MSLEINDWISFPPKFNSSFNESGACGGPYFLCGISLPSSNYKQLQTKGKFGLKQRTGEEELSGLS